MKPQTILLIAFGLMARRFVQSEAATLAPGGSTDDGLRGVCKTAIQSSLGNDANLLTDSELNDLCDCVAQKGDAFGCIGQVMKPKCLKSPGLFGYSGKNDDKFCTCFFSKLGPTSDGNTLGAQCAAEADGKSSTTSSAPTKKTNPSYSPTSTGQTTSPPTDGSGSSASDPATANANRDSANANATPTNNSKSLSTGSLVGIIAGAVVALIAIAAIIYMLVTRSRRKNDFHHGPTDGGMSTTPYKKDEPEVVNQRPYAQMQEYNYAGNVPPTLPQYQQEAGPGSYRPSVPQYPQQHEAMDFHQHMSPSAPVVTAELIEDQPVVITEDSVSCPRCMEPVYGQSAFCGSCGLQMRGSSVQPFTQSSPGHLQEAPHVGVTPSRQPQMPELTQKNPSPATYRSPSPAEAYTPYQPAQQAPATQPGARAQTAFEAAAERKRLQAQGGQQPQSRMSRPNHAPFDL